MKKTILTLLLFLFFLVTKAQVVTFLSLGSATSKKDANGNFDKVKEWIIQETQIKVNLNQKTLQFFSKGMFDRDPFILRKEISILDEITSPNINKDQTTKMFSGIDERGRKCIVRLKPTKDEYQLQEGALQIEYVDHAEIYTLKTLRHHPSFNES